MYPFVWKDYDTNNILVSDEFQRVLTKEDFYDRIKEVKLNNKLFDKVRNDFLKKLPTEDEYYKEFVKHCKKAIENRKANHMATVSTKTKNKRLRKKNKRFGN